MTYQREIDFARRIATEAGENAKRIRAGGIEAEAKPDDSPVTIADRENERIIREAIEREFPDDGILGEEGANKQGTSGRRWIIDPIDGTRDFVRGNRFWCVLIALEEAGECRVGVAHFPMLDDMFWAVRGDGSYRNGDRLQASKVWQFGEAVFCPNGMHTQKGHGYIQRVGELTARVWCQRSWGGALDACLVAAGQADIWFEPKLEVWDIAALQVIVEEAGGAFFGLDGSRRLDAGNAIACAPALEAAVRHFFGVS